MSKDNKDKIKIEVQLKKDNKLTTETLLDIENEIAKKYPSGLNSKKPSFTVDFKDQENKTVATAKISKQDALDINKGKEKTGWLAFSNSKDLKKITIADSAKKETNAASIERQEAAKAVTEEAAITAAKATPIGMVAAGTSYHLKQAKKQEVKQTKATMTPGDADSIRKNKSSMDKALHGIGNVLHKAGARVSNAAESVKHSAGKLVNPKNRGKGGAER